MCHKSKSMWAHVNVTISVGVCVLVNVRNKLSQTRYRNNIKSIDRVAAGVTSGGSKDLHRRHQYPSSHTSQKQKHVQYMIK